MKLTTEYPVIIQDAVPLHLYLSILDELKFSNWVLSNVSNPGEDQPAFWSVPDYDKPNNLYFEAASILKLKIMKHIKRDLSLINIQVNGQNSASISKFHIDTEIEGTITCVLFTNEKWSDAWGGELVVYDENRGNLAYAPYKLNTAAFFPANWNHKGASPNHSTHFFRKTVAFTYCPSELTEELSKSERYRPFMHPHHGPFSS